MYISDISGLIQFVSEICNLLTLIVLPDIEHLNKHTCDQVSTDNIPTMPDMETDQQ